MIQASIGNKQIFWHGQGRSCWYSLAFLWLASWASGNITWPTDSQVRASFLQKRGLALYGEDNLDKLAKMKGISWIHDYTFFKNPELVQACVQAGVEYMPMIGHRTGIFGLASSNLSELFRTRIVPATTKHILGFNEPDDANQANISAELAAANWPLVEAAADHYNLTIVSPMPSKCATECAFNNPFTWWDDFFANCTYFFSRPCRVDVMAMHFYQPCEIDLFRKFIYQVKYKYNRPMMMTGAPHTGHICDSWNPGEWGCWNDTRSVLDTALFMRKAMAFMDDDPLVLRYAWWTPLPSQEYSYNSSTGPNALYYGYGNTTYLTPLGRIYTEQLCPSASA